MKRYLLILLCCATSVAAQDTRNDFQQFRKSLLADYEQTRQEYLSAYADFLDQAWQELQLFKGKERQSRPKPPTPPYRQGAARRAAHTRDGGAGDTHAAQAARPQGAR